MCNEKTSHLFIEYKLFGNEFVLFKQIRINVADSDYLKLTDQLGAGEEIITTDSELYSVTS